MNANRVGDDYIAAGATTYPIFSLGPIPSGCTPPTAVNEVPATTASRIYAWLPVQGTSGDPYYFDWYDPASKQYARGSGVFSFSGTGCTWSSIDASGATLLGLRGLWRVEYWQNNILRNSNTFQLLESSAAPTITAITHAATSAVGPVAPGELITIYGTNLGLPTLTPLKVAASGLVESTLAGSRILFDGVAAPLLYARNDQLGAIVPYSVAGKQSTKVQALFFGSQSSTVDLRVMASAPGLFTLNQQGFGQAAMFNENGSINSASNPANKNSAVVFYATGEGQTLPAGVDGRITQADLRRPIASVSLTIGGQLAEIYYAGAAPTLVSGLMQINARVPPNITGGESVPVVLTVGGFSSRSGVTMAVRQ